GRPAMIFFAVAGPIPGSASSSDCDAELRFTGADGALACVLFAGAACAAKVGTASPTARTNDQVNTFRMEVISIVCAVTKVRTLSKEGERSSRATPVTA